MTRPVDIATDLSAWPLMIITVPDAAIADAVMHRFVEEQRAVLKRHERHALLVDASRVVLAISATQRRLLAAFLEDSGPLTKLYTTSVAIVMESAMARGALTALFWLTQAHCPMKVFSSVHEALEWSVGEMRDAGLRDLSRAEALLEEHVRRLRVP